MRSASATFTITVIATLSFAGSVANVTVKTNTAIDTIQLPAADGGTTPYVYTCTGLPTGLSFSASTRQITGTPTIDGSYAITYQVTDSGSGVVQQTKVLTFNIIVQSLALAEITDKTFKRNSAITTFTLPEATGGSGTKTYTLTGLPTGLSFTASSRQVSGTPTGATGESTITYSVTDSSSPQQSDSIMFKINITNLVWASTQANLVFSCDEAITQTTLPAATGAIGTVTYSVSSLPTGLSFAASTRILSGTPTKAEDVTVVYSARDGGDNSSITQTFKITIPNLDGSVTEVGTINPDGTLPSPTIYRMGALGNQLYGVGDALYRISTSGIASRVGTATKFGLNLNGSQIVSIAGDGTTLYFVYYKAVF